MTTSGRAATVFETDGGSEFFYVDASGAKRDAALHEGMLDNPEADAKCRNVAYKNALERGMSQEDADNSFGPMNS